jgi:hypothetical protein
VFFLSGCSCVVCSKKAASERQDIPLLVSLDFEKILHDSWNKVTVSKRTLLVELLRDVPLIKALKAFVFCGVTQG